MDKDFQTISCAISYAIQDLFDNEKIIVHTPNIHLLNINNSSDFDKIAEKLNVPLERKINGIFGIRFKNCLFRISRNLSVSIEYKKKTSVYYTIELVLDIIL